MNQNPEFPATPTTQDLLWRTDSAQQLVRSAVGWELPIPAHWCIRRNARTIFAMPPETLMDDILPPFEFGTHTIQHGRTGKLGGDCEDRLAAGGARIVRRQHMIPGPCPTTLLDAVAELGGGRAMHASIITERIDDGAQCVSLICRDWSSDPGAARSHALRIWRTAVRTPHPIGPDRRRWIHEAAGLHVHLPTAWFIDADTPTLLVARHRRRQRSQPSLILSIETGPEHAHSLNELRARLPQGTQNWMPARIGNRGGLRSDACCIDQHGDLHYTRQILPEPTSTAAVWALISVDACERSVLDSQQSAFSWTEAW